MKNKVIFLILLFLLAGGPTRGEWPVGSIRTLTLKDAIDIALTNNDSIRIQKEEVEYSRANILYAKSKFLPTLNAGYGYTYTEAVLESNALPNHRKDTRIFSGYKSSNEVNLSLDESIYNGGADIASLEQAKLQLKSQEETLRATKLEVEFEAKRLFYGLLLAYETKRIAQDLISQAEAHYEEVKAMYGQGTASKFDVLQSKVQVSRLMPQLVDADNATQLIMAEFKKLIAIKIKERVKIRGKLAYHPIKIKEDDFLQEAYRNKPEMKLKLLGIDINKWAIEFAKSGWRPGISANVGYGYVSNDMGDMFNPRHDNWNVGVKASINIFDGFATKAKVDQAKAQYNQAELQKEDVIDRIAVDIRTACLNMKKARTIIFSQRESVSEAKEALRLSTVRFDNGVGINLDVLDAQVSLAQVEQNLAQGIYDHIMANAQLDRTMGREFFMEEKYGNKP